MWTVQVVTGAISRPASIRGHKFDTKREAIAFIRTVPHSFIRRIGHTYTIYQKSTK